MTLASLRARLSAPLEWTSAQIKARPKGALVIALIIYAVTIALVF